MRLNGRILLTVAVLFGALCTAPAQDTVDPKLADQLLAIMNQVRTSAGLPALNPDARLVDAARLHLVEFVKNQQISDQYEGEPVLRDRLKTAHVTCGSAGEIMLISTNLDRPADALLPAEARHVLLNPKFSAVGFAVVRSGSQFFVVGNLVQPLQVLSPDAVESLIVDSVQQSRQAKKAAAFQVVPMRQMRKAACDMAKKDSLKAEALNPYMGYINAPSPHLRTFTYSTLDPAELPSTVLSAGNEPALNAISVGACFASSRSYPDGTYWVILMLYGK